MRQHGPDRTVSVVQVYSKQPFRMGLLAGMTKSRVFEPDVFFTDRWDQINYERGYHFSSYLRSKGIRLATAPKKITEELRFHLNSAVREKAII